MDTPFRHAEKACPASLADQPSDATATILGQIKVGEHRLEILSGTPLPQGFIGKNRTRAQLAQHARGFIFNDA